MYDCSAEQLFQTSCSQVMHGTLQTTQQQRWKAALVAILRFPEIDTTFVSWACR